MPNRPSCFGQKERKRGREGEGIEPRGEGNNRMLLLLLLLLPGLFRIQRGREKKKRIQPNPALLPIPRKKTDSNLGRRKSKTIEHRLHNVDDEELDPETKLGFQSFSFLPFSFSSSFSCQLSPIHSKYESVIIAIFFPPPVFFFFQQIKKLPGKVTACWCGWRERKEEREMGLSPWIGRRTSEQSHKLGRKGGGKGKIRFFFLSFFIFVVLFYLEATAAKKEGWEPKKKRKKKREEGFTFFLFSFPFPSTYRFLLHSSRSRCDGLASFTSSCVLFSRGGGGGLGGTS